jgi:hypothetical protein
MDYELPDLVWLVNYLRQLGETDQRGICRKDNDKRLKSAFEKLWQKKVKAVDSFASGPISQYSKARL